MRKMKSEAGSITMVVFATLTFILIILSTIFTTMVYKSKSQTVELKEMINAYDGDMAEIYNAKNKSGYFDLKVGNTELKDVTDITDYYGETTNFESVEGIDWQLFYSDADYYFVIASDYVPVHVLQQQGITELFAEGESTESNPKYKACFAKDENWEIKGPIVENGEWSKGNASNTLSNNPLTSKYLKWAIAYPGSTNYSARALAYMMDMDKWKNFAGDVNGAIAIGGPTMELLVNSFNAVHSGENEKLGTYENIIDGTNATQYGYKVKKGTGEWREMGPSPEFGAESNMWCIQSTEKADAMWLASPSTTNNSNQNMANVDASNYRGYYNIEYFYCGFRPLVAIPRENKVAIKKISISGADVDIPKATGGLANYYGKTVDSSTFSSNEESDWKWQLLYDDSNYVYLIASDYVPNNKLPMYGNTINGKTYDSTNLIKTTSTDNSLQSYCARFNSDNSFNDGIMSSGTIYNNGASSTAITNNPLTSQYLKWAINASYKTSTNFNMKAVAFMMDTTKWSDFAGNRDGAFAIGGPTIELLTASWNAYQVQAGQDNKFGTYETINSDNSNTYGYKVKKETGEWNNYGSTGDLGNTTNMWCIHETNKAYSYWLASPSASIFGDVQRVDNSGGVYSNYTADGNLGFRPVVVIPK